MRAEGASAIAKSSVRANLSFDGEFLYLTDTVGLKVFTLGGGGSVTASVQVEVPTNTGVAVVPGSFNVAPTLVVVGATSDTLIWDVVLDDATPSQTFTFQSTVTGLQPGEARDVTVGTAVNFDFGGTPGLVMTISMRGSRSTRTNCQCVSTKHGRRRNLFTCTCAGSSVSTQ